MIFFDAGNNFKEYEEERMPFAHLVLLFIRPAVEQGTFRSLITQKYFQRSGLAVMVIIPEYDIRQLTKLTGAHEENHVSE